MAVPVAAVQEPSAAAVAVPVAVAVADPGICFTGMCGCAFAEAHPDKSGEWWVRRCSSGKSHHMQILTNEKGWVTMPRGKKSATVGLTPGQQQRVESPMEAVEVEQPYQAPGVPSNPTQQEFSGIWAQPSEHVAPPVGEGAPVDQPVVSSAVPAVDPPGLTQPVVNAAGGFYAPGGFYVPPPPPPPPPRPPPQTVAATEDSAYAPDSQTHPVVATEEVATEDSAHTPIPQTLPGNSEAEIAPSGAGTEGDRDGGHGSNRNAGRRNGFADRNRQRRSRTRNRRSRSRCRTRGRRRRPDRGHRRGSSCSPYCHKDRSRSRDRDRDSSRRRKSRARV